jgi:molybdate transport system substrate-binding protein
MAMSTDAPILLSAGAVRTAIEALLAAAAWPGTPPRVTFGTAGAVRDRILAGEAFDATVLSSEAMVEVAARGKVARATIRRLGEAGIGIAIREGLALPGIGTQAGLLAALDAARSIAWPDPAAGATAGRHIASVLARLGLAETIAAKSTLHPTGVDAVTACGRGEVDIAMTQATEIVGRPGVRLHGLFPAPHALTTAYDIAGAVGSEAAHGLIATLTGKAGRAALAAIGLVMTPQ